MAETVCKEISKEVTISNSSIVPIWLTELLTVLAPDKGAEIVRLVGQRRQLTEGAIYDD